MSIYNKYAVVSAGGIYPDADNLDEYWDNIVRKVVSIKEVSDKYVNKEAHFNADCLGNTDKKDKSYTNKGAQIKELKFNGLDFKIPPSTAKHMDETQKVALLATKEALTGGVLDKTDKNKVSVVMGSSGYGDLQIDFNSRFTIQRAQYYLKKEEAFNRLSKEEQDAICASLDKNILSSTVPVNEDSAPGVLPGILASRISSVFDFHGRAMVVDTACASGLAAVSIAMGMLDSGDSDAVICGGIDMSYRESGFILYSGINALSPDGSFPFDERANGFIIGQGGGVVVLKRLADAIAQGDTILSVITAAGFATDGKGKAIAAPNEYWQAEAIKNAYSKANYPIDTVQYIEAHGTATKVGDLSEVKALKESFRALGATKNNYCGLSSVKSNIAHLKSAAGMAGLIKAILAIKNKTLPPVANFKTENPELKLKDSPFYVIDEARPWITDGHPRRAGVSAFGFGGVNYHITIEEYRAEDYKDIPLHERTNQQRISHNVHVSPQQSRYIFKASAGNESALLNTLQRIKKRISTEKDVAHFLSKNNSLAKAHDTVRLSFSAKDRVELIANLDVCIEAFEKGTALSHLELRGIYFSDGITYESNQIAWVFPGQGAQYAGMLDSLIHSFPSVKNTFVRADNIWKSLTDTSVSDFIFNTNDNIDNVENTLRLTRNTHPAIFTADYAIFNLLKEMGLECEYCIGHSAGELVALTAAGAFSFSDGLSVMESRSKAFSEESPSGKMVALKGDSIYAQEIIDKSNIEVWIANMNSPKQTIISGNSENIERFKKYCQSVDIHAIPVNVCEAFHSPLVKKAGARFADFLKTVKFKPLQLHVISNETGELYKTDPNETQEQLSRQITSSVQFTKGVEALYNKGVRLFVEVGPNAILGNNIKNILEGKDISVIATNFKKKEDLETIYRAFCQLFVHGISLEEPAVSAEAQISIPAEFTDKMLNESALSATTDQSENQSAKRKVVYSGVSVGLPGTFKHAFREDNFQQLFQGKNFIEKLTDKERQSIVDLQVRKLIKSEEGASYKDLDTLNDVIQFASKMGQVDFEKDFGYDPKELATMSSSIAHAVAAGYEALKDAHIPLVHQYTRTSSGALLPEKWALPQYMQKRTGVIFANGFPMVEPVIEEVSRHLSYKLGNKLRTDIFEYYDSLINKITDSESRRLLSDWYALNYSRLSAHPTQEEVYVFNHQFMNQISSQANNRLARYLNAQGPNFLILAACSSTATAITLSEEMIQSGRVDRMIIVSADDTANKNTLPYIGAGFLSTGAASNNNDIYEVAIPFDKRRNGMVVGSGAVGIVLEAEEECIKRGVTPIAELVGTHCFNTAGHPSQLDIPIYADALDSFMSKMTEEKGIARDSIASSLVYMSHEPSTPPKGGCSQSEAVALQHVFGEAFKNIIISNTKGMTGHTMGASIEDATVAKCLQYGKTPPIVNFKEKDPLLEGLRLSKGEDHSCTYALRMAAGFGSQGNYILLKKAAVGDTRIFNENTFRQWLADVSNQQMPELENLGKRLVVAEKDKGTVVAQRPTIPCFHGTPVNNGTPNKSSELKPVESTAIKTQPITAPIRKEMAPANASLQKDILHIVSEVSGYPPEMIEMDMEFEADLGIDTVKQATILGMLSDKFGIAATGDFKISNYPSPKHLLTLIGGNTAPEVQEKITSKPKPQVHVASAEYRKDILQIISEVSGYPVDMLDANMEFEADLGIDTVKQATILGMLSDKFNVQAEGDFRISEYPTPNHLFELIGNDTADVAIASSPVSATASVKTVATPASSGALKNEILHIVSEVSGYPVEMLELDMEFEADLGIDTVKQATILGMLSDKFGVTAQENFKISEYPTPNHLLQLLQDSPTHSTDDIETPTLEPISVSLNGNESGKAAVMQIVSEVSGYPAEMLDVEMEFEADLGIDTVKQATILGLLAERFSVSADENFTISRYPTIGHLIALFPSETVQNKPFADSSALTEATKTAIVNTNDDTVETNIQLDNGSYIYDEGTFSVQSLIAYISEISDYAEEMLEHGTKWNDLFGFDTQLDKSMKDAIIAKWNLSESFTIEPQHTLQAISTLISDASAPNILEWNFDTRSDSLSKQTLELTSVEKGTATVDTSRLSLLIIANETSVAERFSKKLSSSFNDTQILAADTCYSVADFAKSLEHQAVDAIVDLSFLSETDTGTEPFSVRKDAISKTLAFRFEFYKALHSFEKKPQYILALSAIDGMFGLNPLPAQTCRAEFGLISGFYKSLRKEWANTTRTAILDIEGDWKKKLSGKLKTHILLEIKEGLPYVEVCYGKNGRNRLYDKNKRCRLTVADSVHETDIPASHIHFASNDTILVAGGGSGITAEWIKGMSAVFCTNFAVVGRTKLDSSALIHKGKTDEEWNAYKIILRNELQALGKKVTPVDIEKELSKIKKSLDIFDLIDIVRSNGCGIKYYNADLQDIDQVTALVQSIKLERSSITALVHGAGIEISHLLDKKTKEEFFSVVGSKVFSALALEDVLKHEPLKRVFVFSSISGRFGNEAQLDYSAANDFLDTWTRSLNHKGISALSINWSGWDKVGMAVRNSFVKEHSENIGIHLIDPNDGAAAAVRAFINKEEQGGILIHKGIKPMHEDVFFSTNLANSPFVDRIDIEDSENSRSHRVFSPKRDLFLDHHRVRGISLMPGVAYMEQIVEHISLLTNKRLPLVFRDLKFLEGCKFHNDNSKELSVEVQHIGKNELFEARVYSLFKGKIAGLVKEIDFCSSEVEIGSVDNDFIANNNWSIDGLRSISYSEVMANSNKFIYLGPLLNDMGREHRTEAENSFLLGDEGMVQYSWMPYEQLVNPAYPNDKMIINACFMDTLHQAGAIFSLLKEKAYHLPIGAEEFGIIGMGKTFSIYKTTVIFKKQEGDLLYHDILCEDESGKACMYIKNSCYRKVTS